MIISPEELQQRQKWTLDQKIFHSLEVIDSFYHQMNGNVYLAFSGGLDSTLLKYLVDTFTDAAGYKRILPVFNNTTNEWSEILEFVKSFGSEVHWTRPKMTFAQSLESNGFPIISKEQAQYIYEAKNTKSEKLRSLRLEGRSKIGKGGNHYIQGRISKKWQYLVNEDVKITSKCCDILKKRPSKAFEKEMGLVPIIGTMAENSQIRKQGYLLSGCNTYGKRPSSRPLSIWLKNDIWALIDSKNIPYSTIYDSKEYEGKLVKGEIETGCAYCAFGQHLVKGENKFHRLKAREPKRYSSFMDKLGYRKILNLVGIELPD